MMKHSWIKSWLSVFLCVALLFSTAVWPTFSSAAVQDGRVNLALGKDTVASGHEVPDGRLDKHFVVDGKDGSDGDTTSRWSSATTLPDEPQWIYVDLGGAQSIREIYVYWSTANARDYDIDVSLDAQNWTTLKTYQDEALAYGEYLETLTLDEAVQARYVRVLARLGNVSPWETLRNISINEIEVYAEPAPDPNENIALNKPTEASGHEVLDGRLDKHFVNDGVNDNDGAAVSRWSSATTLPGEPQWISIDFEKLEPVGQIDIYWSTAVSRDYDVDLSEDGEHWTTIRTFTDPNLPYGVRYEPIVLDTPVQARYVRVFAREGNVSPWGPLANISITEIEVYRTAQEQKINQVLDSLKDVPPTISEDGTKLVLPESPNPAYRVELFGSDNEQVVAPDGSITQPLTDMTVNLLYRVVSVEDPEEVAEGNFNVSVKIPGRYTKQEGDNEVPKVLPSLREWKGAQGSFLLAQNSALVLNPADQPALAETAAVIQEAFADMLGRKIEIRTGEPLAGDIYLTLGGEASLGKEGYTLDVADILTIAAPMPKGVLYGGYTITQILYQDAAYAAVPKGLARDYPAFEIRSGMIDAARTYIPLEYLEEITKYMAWYKFSEVHVHLNDDAGGDLYAFRLENERYPGLTATDGFYTKDGYRQYQKDVLRYGIEVVSEIDSPAHSACFAPIVPELMLDDTHLDIRKPEAIAFIQSLFDEYLDGDDPVFVGKKVHVGTDEYNTAYAKEMRVYTNDMLAYVLSKGREPRIWSSLGAGGFHGDLEVNNNYIGNIWNSYWENPSESNARKVDMINSNFQNLYIVPGGVNGIVDRLDIRSKFENWSVDDFATERMPLGHPRVRGAEFCIWNDLGFRNTGFSWFDIFDRIRDAVSLVSEKSWYGHKDETKTADDFMERVKQLGGKNAFSNPERFVESDGETVVSYDFEAASGNTIPDASPNGYDAALTGGKVIEDNGSHVLQLDEDSYFSTPFASIGLPYTVSFDIRLDEEPDEDTPLFAGADGTFYLNVDGSGKIGFKRGHYTFTFDGQIPVGRWVNVVLTSDKKTAELYIDGQMEGWKVLAAENTLITDRKDSSTFVLPLERIGGLRCLLDNFKITNKAFEITDVAGDLMTNNLALLRPTDASGHEVPDGRLDKHFVNDGSNGSNGDGDQSSRWSSANTFPNAPQWISIDLEEVREISRVDVYWSTATSKDYDIDVSLDGVNWTTVKTYDDPDREYGEYLQQTVLEAPVQARYVRVFARKSTLHGGAWMPNISINEIEVFGAGDVFAEAKELLAQSRALLAQYPELAEGALGQALADAADTLEQYIGSFYVYESRYNVLVAKLVQAKQDFENAEEPLVITGAPESGSTRGAVTLMAEKEVTWTVNGVEVERASTTIQFRDEGTYTVTAKAGDAVSETIVFSIDRTAPVLTASVEHYGYTNQDVFFNANEEVTFYNGSEIISEGTELTLTESGTYNIRAIDKAGNYTAFYRVTIMKEAPVLTGAPEGVTRSNIAIRSNVKVLFIVNGVEADDYAYGLRILEEGKYTVKAVDMAGNESEVSFEIDRTKPTFTASVPSGQATGKDITLTANEVVDFVIDGVTVATGTEYTISRSGLTVVRIYDVAGNYGGVYKANIDKSAPVLSAVVEGTNKAVENGATVKQNVTVKTSKASYFIVNDGEPTARANFVKLKASGTYTVKAVDMLGNVSEVFTVTIQK